MSSATVELGSGSRLRTGPHCKKNTVLLTGEGPVLIVAAEMRRLTITNKIRCKSKKMLDS